MLKCGDGISLLGSFQSTTILFKLDIKCQLWLKLELIKNVNISSESAGNNNVNVTTRKFVSDNNVNDPPTMSV